MDGGTFAKQMTPPVLDGRIPLHVRAAEKLFVQNFEPGIKARTTNTSTGLVVPCRVTLAIIPTNLLNIRYILDDIKIRYQNLPLIC